MWWNSESGWELSSMICGDSVVHGCLRCCEGVGVLVDIEGGVLSRPKHSEL